MEAVIFNVSFPEGLMAEFYDSERKFYVRPIYPRKGDMVYGLSYRFRRVLYLRGVATPVKFPEELERRERLHAVDRKKYYKGIDRKASLSKKKTPSQMDILSFLKK